MVFHKWENKIFKAFKTLKALAPGHSTTGASHPRPGGTTQKRKGDFTMSTIGNHEKIPGGNSGPGGLSGRPNSLSRTTFWIISGFISEENTQSGPYQTFLDKS